MSLIDDLRHLKTLLPSDVDISSRVEKCILAQKMGATPMEILMSVVMELEPFRIQRPAEYDALKSHIGKLAVHLEGKQRFVWSKIFPEGK